MELKELYNEFRNAWEEMKRYGDEARAEIKQYGEITGETKTAMEAANARIDELEARLSRPQLGGSQATDERSNTAAKAAVLAYARKGFATLTNEEKALLERDTLKTEGKALSLGDDTTGGFLSTVEFANEIIKNIVLFSPIRSYARIRQTSNRSIQVPVRKGLMSARWVGETEQRSETGNPSYGLEELFNHELFAEVIVSIQDLEDSAFDLEAELRSDAAEQLGVAEGAAFVSGNGVRKPEGLLFNPSVATAKSEDASKITANGLIDMSYKLKSAYASNATWLMNRQTVGVVRTLTVAGAVNNFLWQPGLTLGAPSLILDRPYAETVDMPDVAAGTTPIIFGDIKRAYTIVDRVQMTFKRLEEKYAENGQIAIMVRKRVGGQVVLPEAVLKMVVSA